VPAPDRGDDFVWVGGPGEGLRLLIVVFEEAVDRGLQVDDGPKDAALEPALCQGREEALDRVEPGRGRRRGVERPSPQILDLVSQRPISGQTGAGRFANCS
jgi:hypothetical protein